MDRPRFQKPVRTWIFGLALLFFFTALPAFAPFAAYAADESRQGAVALRRQYEQLTPALAKNPFGRPLVLQSQDGEGSSSGDVYARVGHPFSRVQAALAKPDGWCEVLILHINVKYCRPMAGQAREHLMVRIGRKDYQDLPDSYGVLFNFSVQAKTPDYFEVALDADKGPMSTRNYRIVVSAIPLSPTESFLHMRYSYAYGRLGALALRSYLATAGRNKVGFTTVAPSANAQASYVTGLRGLIERNAMRYYLAIDAYLSHPEQPEPRLRAWFEMTENYHRQLHEMDWRTYIDMKRREMQRQLQARPEEESPR